MIVHSSVEKEKLSQVDLCWLLSGWLHGHTDLCGLVIGIIRDRLTNVLISHSFTFYRYVAGFFPTQ